LFEYKGLKIHWLGQSGFKIVCPAGKDANAGKGGKTGKAGKVVYIDPYQIVPREPADVIVITHDHFDHCSQDDVRRLIKSNTVIVTTKRCIAKLGRLDAQFIEIAPGLAFGVDDVKIEAVAAYNTNKFRAPGTVYHPKQDGNIGVILTIGGVRVYHAGDTDFTLEMKSVRADVAMVPVGGTYVMTADEAAEAVNTIKPEVVIPMHYGAGMAGSEKDAYNFQRKAQCKVEIMSKD
jgi:L-ascorbate metabolism protein UlaG (beta-lactamase superfamily)